MTQMPKVKAISKEEALRLIGDYKLQVGAVPVSNDWTRLSESEKAHALAVMPQRGDIGEFEALYLRHKEADGGSQYFELLDGEDAYKRFLVAGANALRMGFLGDDGAIFIWNRKGEGDLHEDPYLKRAIAASERMGGWVDKFEKQKVGYLTFEEAMVIALAEAGWDDPAEVFAQHKQAGEGAVILDPRHGSDITSEVIKRANILLAEDEEAANADDI
jgi:hypothetical protein